MPASLEICVRRFVAEKKSFFLFKKDARLFQTLVHSPARLDSSIEMRAYMQLGKVCTSSFQLATSLL